MRRCGKWVGVVAVALMAAAGCSQTVDGAAQMPRSDDSAAERSYGYVDNRCGLLEDGSVQDVLAADHVVRPYSGAVCQYVLSRSSGAGAGTPPVMLDVVFAWFDTGELDRERAVAVERGAEVTDTVIERHPGFLARRDVTGAACSATAAAGSGVLSWWVQFREGSGSGKSDPCPDAEKLLSATLKSDM